MTLKRKITIILSLSALVLMFLFYGVINLIVNISFNEYKEENIIKRDLSLVDYLSDVYENNNEFSNEVIFNISHQAMMDNYYVILLDQDNNIIWEMKPNMHGMMDGMMGKRDKYIENTYLIEIENKPKVYVKIGHYTSALMSIEDIQFKNNLNTGFIITAIVGLILSILLGAFYARKFSEPIVELKETTDVLKLGKYNNRVKFNSNTKEIDELKVSINHLASVLEEQETLRKRLTSDISHELRTPLNILLNQLEAIMDGIYEPTKERLESCYTEIFRLANLINDLDKLDTLEKDHLEIVKNKESLKDIILLVIQQFEPILNKKNIKIDYQLDSKIYAYVDKDKMIQVMYNLLSNSYKFTESGGSILVKLSRDNNNKLITISDTGLGISKEDLKHIFDRFYRTEKSRNRETGGTGLGLAIVKSIINAHGGSITVNSELNKGTTFVINLPIEN